MYQQKYNETIYAGVLGKMLGVYLGRPVEGWTFDEINQTFGEVYYFKNHKTGAPLIVPDDDLSGTFAFYRAVEDNDYDRNLTAEAIGNAWLNYIIENKTILWWGGLSRCAEHTAYIRLKEGIKAPMSGSVELNGASMAEQIGAQIFIDTWALIHPNDPEQTAKMARRAASVSHDSIAVEAAVFLAVMESLAFEEKDIDRLIDRALPFVKSSRLEELVSEIREICKKSSDWHEVRDWIAKYHGYDRYPGSCPMITNHLVVLMGLLMAGDDFHDSIMIAVSAGWDTDCNAGNLGCLNGIRLGLKGMEAGTDLRSAVADRLYVVTSDGGSCVTDAVTETRKLIEAASRLSGVKVTQPAETFAFEYPGALQGFILYDERREEQCRTRIQNAYESKGESGLLISYEGLGKGTCSIVCVDTFVDLKPKGKDGTSYFDVLCSPRLYSSQEVDSVIICEQEENPVLKFFIDYFNEKDEMETIFGEAISLKKGSNKMRFTVPDTKGHPIYRLGMELTSRKRTDGKLLLKTMDFSNEPLHFEMGTAMELMPALTPWTTQTAWLKSFMSSASNFTPDYTATFAISHDRENGVVTTGTLDWKNYEVTSEITFSYQEGAGLVARAKGHRQYYGAVLKNNKIQIIRRKDARVEILAEKPYEYEMETKILMTFRVEADRLTVLLNGKEELKCTDDLYTRGGAGFVVNRGCILARGFLVERVVKKE